MYQLGNRRWVPLIYRPMEILRDACHTMPSRCQTIKGKKQLSSFHVDSSSLFMVSP